MTRQVKLEFFSILLVVRFFAKREEKQILRCAQDDMSFRVERSRARKLLLVAAFGRAMSSAGRTT